MAEWQTLRSQTPLRATSCGFESHLRYHEPRGRATTRHQPFIGYPTDHLLASFRDPTAAARAAAALVAGGIETGDITILRGDIGAERLDGTGRAHGPGARMRRILSFTVMDQMPDIAWHERTVRDGGLVLMIKVRGDEAKATAISTVRNHGSHFVNYYGRFATEDVLPWQGPEPSIPSILKR